MAAPQSSPPSAPQLASDDDRRGFFGKASAVVIVDYWSCAPSWRG